LVPFEVTLAEMDELSYAYLGFAKHSAIADFKILEKKRYEYVLPFYRKFLQLTSLPNFLLRFISWFLRKFTVEQRLSKRVTALMNKDHDGISNLYLRFN
jgi:fatty acid amide hydrolase